MSDTLGLVAVTGGLAIAGAAVSSTIAILGANWLQSKQRVADRASQKERADADRKVREENERRRLRQEHLAPVFKVMEDLDRHLAHRIGEQAFESQDLRAMMEHYRDKMSPEAFQRMVDQGPEEIRAKVLGPYANPDAGVELFIQIVTAAFRLEGRELIESFLSLKDAVAATHSDDITTAIAKLVRVRNAVIEYAARLEEQK